MGCDPFFWVRDHAEELDGVLADTFIDVHGRDKGWIQFPAQLRIVKCVMKAPGGIL